MRKSNSFSDQVRELRKKLGLSQEELASRLNVSFATVNRWEGGNAKPQRTQLEAFEKLQEDTGGNDAEADGLFGGVATRQRRGVPKNSVLGNKSMEQMLWDAACSVRGEKDAPKFKDYLLPLLFIKRLSDVFDDEVRRLTDQFGEHDTALEVLEADHSLVRFYIPPEARWPVVSNREPFKWPKGKEPKSLGEQLTTTIRAIVKHNPSLAGVIDIVDYNETRNGEREISDSALRGVIETYSDRRYRLGLHDVEPDFLGRSYEYLLRKFAESQGQSAGEFFTPTEVGFLIAEIMRPRPGEECYDYACGSFGLLIKLQLVCRRLDPLSKVPLKLYGQELTGSSYAIACMNKIIHDMQGEVVRGDSMRNPKFKEGDTRLKKFDVVVANPMWNQPFDPDVFENDPYQRFEEQGGTTSGKGDWAWLQHTLATLKDAGRAAVVLDTGAVTRGSGSKNEDKERIIRKWFVERDLIDGVILLPENLFYNMSAAGIIIVLRKNKPKDRKGKIVLVNASQEYRKGTPKNYLTDEAVKRISDAYRSGEPIDGFAAVVTNGQVAKQDYNLHPSKYCGATPNEKYHRISDLVKQIESFQAEESGILTTIISALKQAPPPADTPLFESALPRGWKWEPIAKRYRITKKPRETDYSKHETIPFVPMEAVPANGREHVRFQLRKPQDISSGTYFEKDDVLLSKITPSFENGKQGLATNIPTEFGIASTEIIPLQPLDKSSNSRFLFFYLLHPEVRAILASKMEGSTGRQRVPEHTVRDFPLPVLPENEQKSIAAILRQVQRAVEVQEEKQMLLRALLKTLLHQLMSGQIRVADLDLDTSEIQA